MSLCRPTERPAPEGSERCAVARCSLQRGSRRGAGSSLGPISIGARLLFYSRNFEGSDRHRAWRIARPSGAAERLGCWWWRRLRGSIAEAYGPNERPRACNRRRAPSVCSAAWARLESEHNFTVGQAQRLGNALRPTRGYSFASTAITRDMPSTFLREHWLAFATASKQCRRSAGEL